MCIIWRKEPHLNWKCRERGHRPFDRPICLIYHNLGGPFRGRPVLPCNQIGLVTPPPLLLGCLPRRVTRIASRFLFRFDMRLLCRFFGCVSGG